MMLEFTKMHALGNDFILIDLRGREIDNLDALSRKLGHRRFGVGADQVLVLEDSGTADFRMRVFNADGGEVEMCGNGIRALAKYVWDRGISTSEELAIETLAGTIRPARQGDLVRVDMGEPMLDAPEIPVALEGRVIDHPLEIDGKVFNITCVSMGNPHAVIFVEIVEEAEVQRYGPLIENHRLFPNRTNVEFVQVLKDGALRVRVWERSAGETMACGTGACASVVAASLMGLAAREATVRLDGGELSIRWAEDGRVWMTGPATEVFSGNINIS